MAEMAWSGRTCLRAGEGEEQCFGRTIGKALEGIDSTQGTGVMKVLVTLQ